MNERRGWDFDYIESRFTSEQVGLLVYLAKKEQVATERRQAEIESKLVAAELSKVLGPMIQTLAQGVVM